MRINKSKKAIYFTIDALVFSAILLSAISIIHIDQVQNAGQPKSFFLAKDLMNVFESMTISQLYAQNNSFVVTQYAAGKIQTLNQSVMSQVGEFWSNGNISLAQSLIQSIINGTVPSYASFGVWVENELITASTTPPQVSQSTSWRLVSGIAKNKPLKGYVASARATKVYENNTLVITISPQGSGWNRGYVNITKLFNMSNITINSATLKLSTHTGASSSSDIYVYLNSGCTFQRSAFNWVYSNSEGNVGTKDVKSCLQQQANNLTLMLRNIGYHAHTHPGLTLIINYSTETPLEPATTFVSKRYYFDNNYALEYSTTDRVGTWQLVPFAIPIDATNVSVYMQIVARYMTDYISSGTSGCVQYVSGSGESCSSSSARFRGWDGGWENAASYDYILFLNQNSPFDSDGSPTVNKTYKYTPTQLKPYLKNGTNVATVYLNNYDDYVWGKTRSQIYSSPFKDPNGSSFIEVNYTRNVSRPYSVVEITQSKEFTGSASADTTNFFQYPSQAVYKGDTYVQLVQRYSDQVRVWASIYSPPGNLVFQSPSSRAVPATIFIDSSNFELSPTAKNFIRTQDFGSSGNEILPLSTIEYHFYVSSAVGYGDVFGTQQEALDDAITRLQVLAGSFLGLQTIETDTASIQDVPSLWGPALIEVRAWD